MKFKEMPYERVDYEKTKKTMQELTGRARSASSGEELWQIHQEFYQVSKDVSDKMTIAHIRYDGDTTDAFYSAEQDYYDEVRPRSPSTDRYSTCP